MSTPLTPRIRWLAIALAMLGGCALSFAKLTEDVTDHEQLVRSDARLAIWLHDHATGLLTSVFETVTELGASRTVTALALGAAALLAVRRRPADAALVFTAVAGGTAINRALKAFVERPRPEFADPILTAHGYSFPSGHAMAATTLYGALAYLAMRETSSWRARATIAAASTAVIGAVGASRVYLGVHFLSDVLAAYAAGAAWLLTCIIVVTLCTAARRAPVPT